MISQNVHIDRALSNFARGYRPTGFSAPDLLPVISVPNQSDIYNIWDQADAFRAEADIRAPGTAPREIRLRVSSEAFFCRNYELQAPVTAEELANADPAYTSMLEQGRSATVIDKLMLGWEKRLVGKIFVGATGAVGSFAAVASVWTGAAATPIADIATAIDNVLYATGYKPNAMHLGIKAWNALRRHSTIIDAAQNPNVTAGMGWPDVEKVKALFELDYLTVGAAFENTAQEGLAGAYTPIWSAHCLVFYRTPGATLDKPNYAVNFNWAGAPYPRFGVQRHAADTLKKAQSLSVGYYQDEKVTSTVLGFLLTGATA